MRVYSMKINAMEGKLIYSGTRWCEHILRMNKDRILKDVLHVKQKDRGQDESSRLQAAKISCRRKETEEEKLS
jgi:hypothetical protein